MAAAAEGAGADAVSLLNTLKGMALDPRTRLPWLGGGSGGLSGPAVRAVALEQVAAVSARVGIPVVGMGGIATGADAADFLAAGARVVAVGTESFRDPAAGLRIRRELAPLQGQVPPRRVSRWRGRARSRQERASEAPKIPAKERPRGQVARTTLELKSRSR